MVLYELQNGDIKKKIILELENQFRYNILMKIWNTN